MFPLRFLDLTNPSHRKRYTGIVFLLFLFVAGTLLWEHFQTGSIQSRWQTIQTQERQNEQQVVLQAWNQFVKESAQQIDEIISDSLTLAGVTRSGWSRAAMFERLSALAKPDYLIEIFDEEKSLICWSGKEGIATDTTVLQQTSVSKILRGPLYSYFLIAKPFTFSSKLVGYIVCKRLVDVNYPINNRFITREMFASSFISNLKTGVGVTANLIDTATASGEINSVLLKNERGSTLARVEIQENSLEDRIRQTALVGTQITGVWVIFILFFAGYFVAWLLRRKNNRWMNVVLWTIFLWGVRYILLQMNIPAMYLDSGIVNPSIFASTLWGGIAKSVADVFVSSVFLGINVVIISSTLIKQTNDTPARETTFRNYGLGIILLITASIIGCVFLRGYAAVIHSAVFDSTLSYNDPSFFIPSFPMGLMLCSLFLLACSLMIAGGTGIYISIGYWKSLQGKNYKRVTWLIPFTITVIAVAGFELVHPSPLFNTWERLAFFSGFTIAALTYLSIKSNEMRLTPRTVLVLTGLSIAAVLYPLDRANHELDHSYVEASASEFVHPSDGYIKLIVRRAITELTSNEIGEIFISGDSVEIQKIAFKTWAKSILGKEGYNCAVTYYAKTGAAISSFSLEVKPGWFPQPGDTSFDGQNVFVEDRRIGNRNVTIYRTAAMVRSKSGEMQGIVSLEMSTGKQSVFGGDVPDILRNYSNEETESYNRPLILSEYAGGILTYSTSDNFLAGTVLPVERFEKAHTENFWINQTVKDDQYETYFCPLEGTTAGTGIAISILSLDFRWHLFIEMRLLMFYSAMLALLGLLSLLFHYVRGQTLHLTFRTKLLLAFIVIALVPTAIFAYYNRAFTMERSEQATSDRLKRETGVIASALQRQWGIDTPFDLSLLTNEDALHIANDVDIDFSLFGPEYEKISSEPEVFQAELFDKRLQEDAYQQCVLRENTFYSNVQSIGTLQYVVGYRPLFSETGSVIGVVAIPTLFRHRELSERLMQRNAYLFGAFAVAMFIALGVGILFSNQISSPVRRLYEATLRTGKGDLDFKARSGREDEFGELEKAFEKMLSDLKTTQAEMMRAQREFAWKEMAKQVAHEIKNPLTPMKLSLQHLQQAYDDKAPEFEQLLKQVSGTLLEQINSLNRIASEFSQFARMPERKPEPCDLHAMLRDVTKLFGEYPDITFHLQLIPNSPIIIVDREELQRAFVNVLRNAVQAMNERGMITLMTKQNGTMIKIDITDSGQGIPEEIKGRLFEPNFSTKTDGTGLGLPIVKQIINSYGGIISLKSEIGKGTTVSILLPFTETAS